MVFSHREDVSLANPFGPVARGWDEVARTMERAAALYRDGEITGFENIRKYVTPELAYIVEEERFRTKVAGREELSPWPCALRASFDLKTVSGR